MSYENKGYTKGNWRVVDTSRVPYCGDHVADLSNELLIVADGQLGNALADANLISAAKDLLESLQDVLRAISWNDDEGLVEHAPEMERARAAIAKATGRT